MGSILVLVGLSSMILSSLVTKADIPTEAADWGEKEEVWRWNVEDYPNPQRQPQYCNRFSASNVCDPDSVLEKEHADRLDLAIRTVYNNTPCLCPECSSTSGGIVIGIAVMKHVFLPYNEHPSIVIRDFAEELRKLWSLGQCKNEVIIVLVTGDRMSSTSVGSGISSHISPQELRIFQENKGYFTVGNYYQGLSSMVQAYYDLSQSIRVEEEPEPINTGLIAGIVVGVIMLFVLLTMVGCTLRRKSLRQEHYRRNSGSGYPSDSWKQHYRGCSIEEVKIPMAKGGDTENNNDQDISTGLQERDTADETAGPNQTLLTTVAESENEDDAEDNVPGCETPLTNINGKSGQEINQAEPGDSSRIIVANI